MPTTSNFGWTTPADTDLVKDGAAAIRTLGNGIDTSFLDLKGGTTGQNLRKASNTDLDFTFAGDATNTVVDAAGDLLYGTAADTLGRLPIGTAGQVLKVNSGATAPEWGAPGGGKVLQVVSTTYSTSTTIASTSFTDTGLSLAITPSATSSKVLVLVDLNLHTSRSATGYNTYGQIVRGVTAIYETHCQEFTSSSVTNSSLGTRVPFIYLDSPSTTSSTTYKVQIQCGSTSSSQQSIAQVYSKPSSITLLEIGA